MIDRIYIKNPQNSSIQGYWRRNGVNNTGDLISFVKENLSSFGISGRNELDSINKVLHKFAGREFELRENLDYKKHSHTERTFDPERWTKIYSPQVRDKIFSARGISTYTTLAFSKHIDIVQDQEQQGKYSYVGFPYKIPGDDTPIGYELRGMNGFKSKASGTNSHEGMWLATFSDNPLDIKNIYIAESAFDALAFYQIHKERINLQSSAFVSFGGSFSDSQFEKLREHFPTARPVLLFDKDINGHMYDIRAIALMANIKIQARMGQDKVDFDVEGRKFSIDQQDISASRFSEMSGIQIPTSRMLIYKPKEEVKDWNDLIMSGINHTPYKHEVKR